MTFKFFLLYTFATTTTENVPYNALRERDDMFHSLPKINMNYDQLNLSYKDVVCKSKKEKTFVIENIPMKKSHSRIGFCSDR